MPTPTRKWFSQKNVFLAVVLVLTAAVSYLAVILPLITPFDGNQVSAGSVAEQDYLAPSELTFESEALTAERREQAASSIAPIYSPPDAGISRRQSEKLRSAVTFINAVRADAYAAQDQKLADLASLEGIRLEEQTALSILGLNGSRWTAVQVEALDLLEQLMGSSIRDTQLENVRLQIPTLIDLSLPAGEARIVAELVSGFIAPNSLNNPEATEAARQAARQAVEPVMRTFIPGQTIVQRGRILAPEDVEALQQFGLTDTGSRWQDLIGAGALVAAAMAYLSIYLLRSSRRVPDQLDPRGLTLNSILFLAFLLSARLISPGHTILPYLVPIAAYALLVSTLFGPQRALVTALPLAVLCAYDLPNALELTLFYLLGCLFGVLVLDQGTRISTFFWTGVFIAASGVLVIAAYRIPDPQTDWIGIATLAGASLVNGIASTSLTLLLQQMLAQLLGKVTAIQLYELSRPDHPLLKQLLQKAPGTYQHSLQVANLVEQAAERIGADPLLARIGALYHDVGKIENPPYFIENQIIGSRNPHDDLPPEASAGIIIRHVDSGLALAKRYRIPARIRDFIAEHHGAGITHYQYSKAVSSAGSDESLVDKSNFTYPGPNPLSRETALLMLADATEASIRAKNPQNEDEMRDVIRNVIEHRVANGSLQDCNLTLSDLKMIGTSFTETLRGIYHPRIEYPELRPIAAPAQDSQALESHLESELENKRLPPQTEDNLGSLPPQQISANLNQP